MTRRKKTKIVTETERVLIFNRHSGAVEGWCDHCDEFVGMVRPEDAVTLAAFRLRAVYRQFETDKLHFVESQDGSLRVCLNSLLKPV